jgi:hypothetical protein
MTNGDPVSWYLIESGWRVEAADGTEIAHVVEVIGDENEDIFDGLAVASGLHRPRYVPSEKVSSIVVGTVSLTLSRTEVETLEEYVEPPPSLEIEGEKASLVDRAVEQVEELIGDEAGLPVKPERVSIRDRVRAWLKSLRR